MKYTEFKRGMLVEPIGVQNANQRPANVSHELQFVPGMIGVVNKVHKTNGVLVEYFDPTTGLIEKCRTKNLKRVDWPAEVKPLDMIAEDPELSKRFWMGGDMDYLACKEYLLAIKAIRIDYLRSLYVQTLRIPGVDMRKLRTKLTDPPKQFYRALIQDRESLIIELTEIEQRTGTNG